MSEIKHMLPDFMKTEDYINILNSLNKEFKIQPAIFTKFSKPFFQYFTGGDISISEFISNILEKITQEHPRYFEFLVLKLNIQLQQNKIEISNLMSKNDQIKFEIELASNGIYFPVDYNKNEYEIKLLKITNENPEKLESLIKIKIKDEKLNKMNIMEEYKKRPYEN